VSSNNPREARAAGLLYVFAAGLTFVALLVPGAKEHQGTGVFLMAALGLALGVGTFFLAPGAPEWYRRFSPLAGIGLVTGLLATSHANLYGLFYFWILAFVAHSFRPRLAIAYAVLTAGVQAGALLTFRMDGLQPTDWAIVMATLGFPLVMIGWLRSSARAADERFRLVLEAAPDGVLIVDDEGRIAHVNAQLESLLGYDRSELVGEMVERLMPASLAGAHVRLREGFTSRPHARAMGPGRTLMAVRRDGEELPVQISLSPMRVGGRQFVIASLRDDTLRRATELERERLLAAERRARREVEALRDELARAAATDGLTGLLNRRQVDAVAAELIELHSRNGRPLACLMVDLDDFKAVNDRFGHATGDTVIRAAAERLAGFLRHSDVVGRYGGDEFVVLLPETDAFNARGLADKIERLFDEPLGGFVVGATVGSAAWRPAMTSPAALYAAADARLYRRKASGGALREKAGAN